MNLFKPHGKHAQGAQGAQGGKTGKESAEAGIEPQEEAGSDAEETQALPQAGASAGGETAELLSSDVQDEAPARERAASREGASPKGPAVPNVSDASAPGFVSAGFEGMPTGKRRSGAKAAGISLGVIVALVVVAYVAGALAFSGRFMPGTSIGGSDISLKSDEEVVEQLVSAADGYQLDAIGDGFSYRVSGGDIGLSIDAEGLVQAIHADQNAWEWPVLVLSSGRGDVHSLPVEYSRELLERGVSDAVVQFNATATAPVDATIVYSGGTGKFEVVPETMGTQLDLERVLGSMRDAVETLDYKVVLDEADLVQPAVLSTDAKLAEAADLASGMVSAKLTLVMGGKTLSEIDGDDLSGFITIDESFAVVFREEEMSAWVNDLAYSFDTIGTERVFTRADGKQVVVPAGGVYGWEVDSEALKGVIIDGIKAGTVAEVQVPCVQEAAVYNGANQRDWGERYIDVDISEQHVRFYGDDGSIIWESDCITGSPDGSHDTVPGTWYVNNKESPSKLIGYENGVKQYETTVKYWMAFEYNGIGFHDATWQPSFGGSMYSRGYGSHGCVNLSYSAAESLYDIIEVGDVVVVHA